MRSSPGTAGIPVLVLVAVLAACSDPGRATHATTPGSQTPHRLTTSVETDVSLPYLLFTPLEYGRDPERRWPLLLFLHGAGTRGDDLDDVRGFGPAARAERDPDFPFVLASPQCPEGSWWRTEELVALLDHLAATLAIDRDRVCVTGVSMGGFGAWNLALEYPERFAGVAPLCGGGDMMTAYLSQGTAHADALRELDVWAIHGDADRTVPLAESRRVVDALRFLGNDVRFTVVEGAGHDVWTATYADPMFYAWLLERRRVPTVP